MKRHQNAHAIVNAGFNLQLSAAAAAAGSRDGSSAVSLVVGPSPLLVYGGLLGHAQQAAKTQAYLVGKDLADAAVLKAAIHVLGGELWPTSGADIPYRKALVVNLFYKAVTELYLKHGVATPPPNASGKLLKCSCSLLKCSC